MKIETRKENKLDVENVFMAKTMRWRDFHDVANEKQNWHRSGRLGRLSIGTSVFVFYSVLIKYERLYPLRLSIFSSCFIASQGKWINFSSYCFSLKSSENFVNFQVVKDGRRV